MNGRSRTSIYKHKKNENQAHNFMINNLMRPRNLMIPTRDTPNK